MILTITINTLGGCYMERKKVLFVCVHNSGRSQMAEVFLNHLAEDRFLAESAGLEPTFINPLVTEVMKEIGFDLSLKKTTSVFELFRQGRLYDYVITVCDDSSEKKCPVFPGIAKRLHWPFDDPESITGNYEQKMESMRRIRDNIRAVVQNWIN
jgi:arsenate reductase